MRTTLPSRGLVTLQYSMSSHWSEKWTWSPSRCIRASCNARHLRCKYTVPSLIITKPRTILEEVGNYMESLISSCTKRARNRGGTAAAEAYHARCSHSTLIEILQESEEAPGSTVASAVGPQHAKSPDYVPPHSPKHTKIQVRRKLPLLPMLQHI